MSMIKPTETSLDDQAIIASAEQALSDIASIRAEVSKVIFGQESVVENTLLALLAGGHALLVGVPGLAKTKLVTTLGARGVGEAGTVAAGAAIWTAVNDALSPLGAVVASQPITPEHVLDSIDRARTSRPVALTVDRAVN